jgi:hypothetical protein
MDIEGAGGAVTGGLVAAAVEKPAGHAGEDHIGTCSDCGAETSGNFCSNCGQPTHVHRTLLHLGEELLHGVMHFDARIWRTLPLLWINPGRLTREWVEGRRSRYVSPLAMFLFTVFIMFFALSFAPHKEVESQSLPQQIETQRKAVADAEAALQQTRSGILEQRASEPVDPAGQRITDGVIRAAEAVVTNQKTRLAHLEKQAVEGRGDDLAPGSWQANLKDSIEAGQVKGEGLGGVVLKKLKNPDLALYKLQQTTYKFAFLLVPLSIPFVALLFLWKRGFTLYDHGVFVLYSLTFMAMLGMVVALGAQIGPLAGLVIFLGLLAVPVHMFAQLKGAYSLSIFSALWRTVLLVLFANFVVGLFVTAIVYLGLGH